MTEKEKVLTKLNEWEIPFEIRNHNAAATIEDALKVWEGLEGVFCKNIFLRNYKGNQHFLVVLEHNKILNTKTMEKIIGGGRVSFASHERLWKHLGLTPGSVSPFGLINDSSQHVIVFLDEDLKSADKLNFHPNDNTATLTIAGADFFRFLALCGNTCRFLTFEASPDS